jgi:hypothetical protein
VSDNVVNLTERRLLRNGFAVVHENATAQVLCAACGEWKADVFQWTPEHGLRCESCSEASA